MQTPGVIFIKLVEPMRPHIDVMALAAAILNHITGPNGDEMNCLTRFTCRFLPIFILQKVNMTDFIKMCLPEVERVFKTTEPIKWCTEFKAKGNEKAIKSEYVDAIRKCVDQCNSNHQYSYDFADVEVLIEVYRDCLMFSVLPRYKKLKKYNLMQLTGQAKE